MGSYVRPSAGAPPVQTEHQTVIVVGQDGVAQNLGGGGVLAAGAAADTSVQAINTTLTTGVTHTDLVALGTKIDSVITLLGQQREIGDRIVQDSTSPIPQYVVIRTTINEGTGAVTTTTLNLDNTVFGGTLVTPIQPLAGGSELVPQQIIYTAKTTNGANWTIGQEIVWFRVFRQNNTLAFESWTNTSKGTTLGAT